MSNNKSNAADLARIFQALANPHRVELILTLLDCCGAGAACDVAEDGLVPCVGEVGKDLNIAPSTLSHHLKELQRAGLIVMERRGKNVYCQINQEKIADLAQFFGRTCAQPFVPKESLK
jgi:ArsR family transcriptional regulator